ncbi:nuclease sbcCD subunit C, putative [Entamoeba histolytica HM-3:IMSS]|uniref:Nuclease sbcCD subunit C, putative n=2 Tax=Entamoeba histolytica TaxID=5759 RepID=M2Q7I1_ENTHI|nr:nuclease sbcCD subunit C, putative [Entamoeba histolytica KU27]EMS11532.1 nuclease sbcCD subunit C, putative [Entamoeba histolytica HM-3:IMSS]
MKRTQSIFNDKRKQKKQVGAEEGRAKKWFEQRIKQKKDKYNINEESEEEEEFTHEGVALSKSKMGYTDVPVGVIEEDTEEEKTDMTKKGRYAEIIEKSKKRKAEKAIERQEQEERLEFLNENIEDIIGHVSMRQSGDDNFGDEYVELLAKMQNEKTRAVGADIEEDVHEARKKRIQEEINNIEERINKIGEGGIVEKHRIGEGSEKLEDEEDLIKRIEKEDIRTVVYKIGDKEEWGKEIEKQEELAEQAVIILKSVEKIGVLKTTEALQSFIGEIYNRRKEMRMMIVEVIIEGIEWKEDLRTLKEIGVISKVWSSTDLGSMITMKIMEYLGGLFYGVRVEKERFVLQSIGAIIGSEISERRYIPELIGWIRKGYLIVKDSKRKKGIKVEEAITLEGEELKGYVKDIIIQIVEKMIGMNRKEINSRMGLKEIIESMKGDEECKRIVEEWNKEEEKMKIQVTLVEKKNVGMIKMFNPRLHEVDLQKEVREVKKKIKEEARKASKIEEGITQNISDMKRYEEEIERQKQKKAYGKILNELQGQQSEWKKFDKKKGKQNYKKKVRY